MLTLFPWQETDNDKNKSALLQYTLVKEIFDLQESCLNKS